jgi:hypothetical protein
MYVRDVAFDWSYADEPPSLLAYVTGKGLYRSIDGGQLWRPATMEGNWPTFGESRSLFGIWDILPDKSIYFNRFTIPLVSDVRWSPVSNGSFLYDAQGTLSHSEDGGASWTRVLEDNHLAWSQMAYDSQIIFLVTRPWFRLEHEPLQNEGRLYRSLDGGRSWEQLVLPENKIPTAVTISPAFTHDHLIFIGTADGQILLLDGLTLPAAPPTP